jgi:hypothetical protein
MQLIEQFELSNAQALRGAAVSAASFPDASPDGWHKSPVDPCALLDVFSSLRLRGGYVLRAYSFREGGNGNAFVFAQPVDLPFPKPDDCCRDKRQFLEPPVPPGSLADVMEAIEGDGSPWSYLSASLLRREFRNFGARWHGIEWSTHYILGENPLSGLPPSADMTTDGSQWEWMEPEPRQWLPTVAMAKPVIVRFFSYTGLGQERIVRHLDTYHPGKYSFDTEEAVIARGPSGFCF